MRTHLYDGEPIPTVTTPVARQNAYTPGTCKWVAHEAINRLVDVFTEDDIEVQYYIVKRLVRLHARNARRTISAVVSELVKRGVLTRVAPKQVKHADQR